MPLLLRDHYNLTPPHWQCCLTQLFTINIIHNYVARGPNNVFGPESDTVPFTISTFVTHEPAYRLPATRLPPIKILCNAGLMYPRSVTAPDQTTPLWTFMTGQTDPLRASHRLKLSDVMTVRVRVLAPTLQSDLRHAITIQQVCVIGVPVYLQYIGNAGCAARMQLPSSSWLRGHSLLTATARTGLPADAHGCCGGASRLCGFW
jgi:hypothetical protein